MGALEQLLKKEGRELPAFPELGLKILQTFLTKTPRELEEFLITEREVSEKLIYFANLPPYKKGEAPIENPRTAILILGEDTAKILTLGLISQKILLTTFNEFSFPKFWARALSNLVFAFYLADLIENFSSHLPLSAYLMDYGIILLYLINPEKYLKVLHLKREGLDLCASEKEVFGTNHAEVGGDYFEIYNLPRRFVLNLRYHHTENLTNELPREILEDIELLKVIDLGVGSFFSTNREEKWKAFEEKASKYLSIEEIQVLGEIFPTIANRYLELFGFSQFKLKTFRELEEEKKKELERLGLEEKKKQEDLIRLLEEREFKILSLKRERKELEEWAQKLREKLERESIYDELTGAYKEEYFLKRLKEEFLRAKRYRRIFSLLMVELKDLSEIGKNLGLQEEEKSFASLVREILSSLRRVDLVGRASKWGRLYILLPETPSQGAMVVARKILRRIEEFFYRNFKKRLSAYITVITYDPKDIDPKKEPQVETLLTISEKGLEVLKRRGHTKILLLTIDKEIE